MNRKPNISSNQIPFPNNTKKSSELFPAVPCSLFPVPYRYLVELTCGINSKTKNSDS
ncbi:MAG: hypothetical protein F6K56_09570 [Moorea sp. SIO3G5]|nr:hypothetical protein [Moorena sp. SIO3G5]